MTLNSQQTGHFNTDKQFLLTTGSVSISDHIVFSQSRPPFKKIAINFSRHLPFGQCNWTAAYTKHSFHEPANVNWISFFFSTKASYKYASDLKSDCRQLSTESPYGLCIYEVMRLAPGVQSGHYLGDATAPVVKVTRSTPDILTLYQNWRILNV